jgi:two-component system response regulator RegA
MNEAILVVDDDPTFNAVMVRALVRRGYDASGALSAEAAIDEARRSEPDCVVLDLNLGEASGLTLIRPLLDINPACRIVVLTGYASIATAVDAIKLGAQQYLSKPVEVDTVIAALSSGGVESVSPAPVEPVPMSVDRLEWEHIQRVLRENDGNISSTARALNMHRRTLQRKLSKRPVKK